MLSPLTRASARALVSVLSGIVLSAVPAASADATPVPTALIPHRVLTAGGYDHFQGELSPDGSRVYFAGNADSTIEIFSQSLERGLPRLLFDDAADVGQPRVSPDGRRLLFISYQRDAGGDACVIDIGGGGGRRCLTQQGVSVLHVFWFPDGRSVGALTRRGVDGAHQLRRFSIDHEGREGELILEETMSAPAISPDGRWLAYVPLERREGDEGARSGLGRASRGLVLRRLDGDARLVFVPDLPGTSSFPAFAVDGAHLYFTQYLNDTNFDGVIDGDDNGVLFRVPFRGDDARPVRPSSYQQLTSGVRNCQYPAPAREALVATCVRGEHLQVDAIPLDGVVDGSWGRERIEAEIAASRDPWEQLLLLQRIVALETDPQRRREVHRRLVLTHVGLREYESADVYLAVLERDAGSDAGLAEWVAIEREIVAHRREEQRLSHGNLSTEFVEASHARLARLERHFEVDTPSARRLARIAESEIYLVLGDKRAAMRMFEAIDVGEETDVAVLQSWMRLAEMLLRDLGDRERWIDVHRRLSSHPALGERDRLHHAEELVAVLGRGRAPGDELPRIREERARTRDGTQAALLLDLEWVLARVPELGEEAAEAEIDRLWRRAPSFEQHRAVALATIDRALHHDWARLLHTFGERWLSDVPEDHAERKYAESLYAEVMLERAYVERRAGRSARALFRAITERTPSLEAHVGYVEASLAEGMSPDAIRAEYRERFGESSPIDRFAEAYVVARGLPAIEDPERHASEIARARALLRPAAEAMPRAPEVHHLYAYLAHRHHHRTGDSEAALAAHSRYHLALDLTVGAPRMRANVLAELGLLQSALGNHRIALRHFAERERLPFVDPESELSFRLAKARSLFHAASYAEARAEIDRALAVVDRAPQLARYRPVVLDRGALYHYASGDHEGAAALYRTLVEATRDQPLAVRLKAHLGLGAAALAAGDAEGARQSLEHARALLDTDEPFRVEDRVHHALSHFERDDYRPLVAGLLSQSRRATGDLRGAADALDERRELYRERFVRLGRDAYLLEVARISQQLAELAYRAGDHEAARARIEEGLADADRWRRLEEGTEIEEVTLALVRSAAELHVYGGVPLAAFSFDLERRVRETFAIITRRPNPRWADERFLFPIYLALIEASP